ncbi:MAG: hypothetical protein M3R51_07090 [Candidatus Eremiobacteraeota bacterium]|nr:hypothetical protein [Candidatus Eremiobacteraeota bacterium]
MGVAASVRFFAIMTGLLLWAAATGSAQAGPVSGVVVDGETGRPISGVTVALSARGIDNNAAMSGDDVARDATTVQTDRDGKFVLWSTQSGFLLTAYGKSNGRVAFHGVFPTGGVGTIKLLRPTREERSALAQLNAFRAARGIPGTLAFDENLMESARYWAALEGRTQRVGHTCASLGNPKGCIEFNAFYHQLPGAPREQFCGQNAAFDEISSWTDPDQGFEDEEHQSGGERGHYLNIISADRWVGLGKTGVPGVGTYFAMNML